MARRSAANSPAPSLDTKSRPSRQRGIDTFEVILTTAGELLAEVGFERLTTNLVCQRAGLTPPALYRYFPNKYALLKELAHRLMDAQDQVVLAWLENGGTRFTSLEDSVAKNRDLQKQVNAVTRAFPGGDWILRALRALPVLQERGIDHHRQPRLRDAARQDLHSTIGRFGGALPIEAASHARSAAFPGVQAMQALALDVGADADDAAGRFQGRVEQSR